MKKIILSLILCSLFFATTKSNSQSRTFFKILKMNQKGSGPILQNDRVTGYYLFYKMEKAKKGVNTYLLRILDENLNDFQTSEMEESTRTYLAEGSFNGETILFKFADIKRKKLIFRSYDKNAQLIDKTERDLEATELRNYKLGYNGQQTINSLFDVGEKGFVDYSSKLNGAAYAVNFIPSDNNMKGWELNSPVKGYQSASYLSHSENVVFSLVARKPSMMSKDLSFEVCAIDISTGEMLFTTELADAFFAGQPLGAYFDQKTGLLNVMGIYYEAGTKVLKDNGLGLFKYQIDRNGEIVNKNQLSWTKDFRKFVTVDDNGKITNEDKNGFLYFHNIVQHPDGSVIAVAEQYKKAADAAGIAMAALGGGTSTTKVVINDMVLFKFTEDFSIDDVVFISKSKSNFTLPGGYDFMNIHLLSHIVKVMGGFDYSFTLNNRSEESISIGYVDYEKKKGAKNEWIFGAVTYYDGEFISDKITLGSPNDNIRRNVIPGKPGYITIINYDRLEKKVEMHLEKINY